MSETEGNAGHGESADADALRMALAFRQTILNSAHNALVITDADGRITTFNAAAERMFGYRAEEIVGKARPDIFHDPEEIAQRAQEYAHGTGQTFAHPFEAILARAQSGDSSAREWMLVRKDGTRFPVLLSVAPLRGEGTGMLGYIGMVTDISMQRQTERAWQEQSQFLQIVLDAIPSPIFFKDRRGAFLGCNGAYEEFIGKPRSEIVGKTVHDLMPKDLADIYHAADQQLYNRGGVQQYDSFVVAADGTPREVVFHKAVLKRGGTITGLVGAILDITERKRAEEKLRESEAKYRELVQSANSIILRMDTDGVVTFFNEYAQRFFGFTENDILGRNVVGTIVPETDTAGRDLQAMILDIGHNPERYATNENENVKRNGERAWIAWTNRAIHDGNGNVVEILCVGNDYTERKRADLALRASELRFRDITDSAGECIWEVDTQGRYTYATDRIEDLLGWKPTDVLGKTMFNFMPAEDVERVRAQFMECFSAGQPLRSFEHRSRHRDGRIVWQRVSGLPYRNESGQIVGYRGTALDITDQKETEYQLHQAKDAAEAANRAKTAFLASMSHEIRTPMTAILGYADLLLHVAPSQRHYNRWVRDLRRNCDHLLALLNDVLDLSKIEAGQMELHIEDVRIADLLEEVAVLLRPHASEKGLSFDVAYHSRMPTTCRTDALRLRQILLNLSTNAIKFTDKGRVCIDVSARQGDGDARLLLSVSDTGIGIPLEQLDQLFKPFSQVHLASRRQYGGTGLGLSISQRLANALGGLIIVESEPGKGSVFTLDLPIRSSQGVQWMETHEIRRSRKPDLSPLARLDDRRILLVEDGPDNQRILSYMLEGAGAVVTIAANGQEGVKAFDRKAEDGKAFDLVLMDIQMPIMDGYEATRTLRAKGVKTPIVALTAFAMSGDREACLAAGCNDYLPKPITTASLLAKLSKYLQGGKPMESPPAPEKAPDVTIVRSRLADDPRFSALVRDFQADLANRITELENARCRSDDETIRTHAHRLKSAAGMLGFDALSVAAANCEQAWREERADKSEMLTRLLGWLHACHTGRREGPA